MFQYLKKNKTILKIKKKTIKKYATNSANHAKNLNSTVKNAEVELSNFELTKIIHIAYLIVLPLQFPQKSNPKVTLMKMEYAKVN